MRSATPRQTAEAAADSLKGLADAESTAKYAAMIAFLDDAVAGRSDLDWRGDAKEASRRELRRKREMKVALAKIGAGFKALGQISGDDPSAQALADAITFTQPDDIHLTPSQSDWPSEATRAQTAALLTAEGFPCSGRPPMPWSVATAGIARCKRRWIGSALQRRSAAGSRWTGSAMPKVPPGSKR